jgi:hypothetical protein
VYGKNYWARGGHNHGISQENEVVFYGAYLFQVTLQIGEPAI